MTDPTAPPDTSTPPTTTLPPLAATPGSAPSIAGGSSGSPPSYLVSVQQPRFAGDAVIGIGVRDVLGFGLDGQLQWASPPCENPGWASPFPGPATVDVVVVLCNGEYEGLNVSDGTIRWTHPAVPGVDRVRLAAGVVLLNGDQNVLSVVDLETGADRFSRSDLGSTNGAATSGSVYAANDEAVYALDPSTGTQRWRTSLPTAGLYATDGSVFARSRVHQLVRLDEQGNTVWTSGAEVNRLTSSDVVGVTKSAVIVFSAYQGYFITAYDRDSGAKLWTRDSPTGSYEYPALGSDIVAISNQATRDVTVVDDRTGDTLATYHDTIGNAAGASGEQVAFFGEPDPGHDQGLRIETVR
jgi:hypothetical protein